MYTELIEYLKLHKISLSQDLEDEPLDSEIEYLKGALDATNHILAYVEGLDKALTNGVK
jgi:hypothetical protein